MRIALVENDEAQRKALSAMLGEELTRMGSIAHTIGEFDSGESFLAHWQPGQYDLILLDIFMGELSGIEAARQIRRSDQEVLLAFCTSSNEFASESYEVNASYYLQKPVSQSGIANLLSRIGPERMELNRAVRLPDGHSVLLRSIVYTEYFNHVVTVHLTGEPPYRLRTSQAAMEELLLHWDCFRSPNRGIIVNFHEVEALTDDACVVSNHQSLPITRRKYKEFKAAYTRFRFQKMRREVDA